MVILLKNITLIYSILYSYIRILNIEISRKKKYSLLMLFILSSLLITYIENKSAPFAYVCLILITITAFKFFLKLNILQTFVSTLISYAISYVCFLISSTIICTLFFLFKIAYKPYVIQILILLLQLFTIKIPFLSKRTRKGMPFLWKNKYYIPFSIIGLIIFIISLYLNIGKTLYFQNSIIAVVCFLSAFFIAYILIIYWRTSLTKTYLDALTKRNNLDLNNQLEQITRKYDELYADKERLSAIVHSDKKLVNALKNAVMNYLENGNNDNERGKELLEEIERYSKEREGNIQETEKFLNPLPSCNIVVIDNLLAYMYQKAQQNNIELSLMINCDVVAASKDLINLEDFSTLLADLIDNAIIATIHNKGKLILVSFSIVKKHFTIQISDSGIPFTTEVLYTMGKERITTHADDNGNGIGLMQTFETLHKTNASLFIEEYNNPQAIYTKSLSVVFNKKNQTVLYTTRDQMEIAQLYQKSNFIIMKK